MAISIEELLNIPAVRVLNSEVNEREISIQLEFAISDDEPVEAIPEATLNT